MAQKEGKLREELKERLGNGFDNSGACRLCGERFLTKEDKVQHLLNSERCALHAGAGSTEGALISVVGNEIVPADRFGQGVKKGKLYYGFLVADNKGEIRPAVLHGGNGVYGSEHLDARGFSFDEDFVYVEPNAWDRHKIKEFLVSPRPSKTTEELFEGLLHINKRCIHHDDEAKHLVAVSYTMLSYLFTAFPACPRLLVHGLAESGKSQQTDIIASFSCNPTAVSDASKSSIFRTVEVRAGLVAVDNFDNRSDEEKKNLIDLYDTSFEEGRATMRTEETGKKKRPKLFRTYCPMVLNCVSTEWMPRSSVSRSVFVPMYKKGADVELRSFRDFPKEDISALQHELRLWALQRHEDILKAATGLKTGLSNRDEDISRPLLAIAKEAGEKQYKALLEYLRRNFEEHHVEEDFSDDSMTLIALWELARKAYGDGVAGEEVRVFVADVAEAVLLAKGVPRYFEEGKPNHRFGKARVYEARRISAFLKSVPSRRRGLLDHRRWIAFNIRELERFMLSRGLVRADREEEGGQTSLQAGSEEGKE